LPRVLLLRSDWEAMSGGPVTPLLAVDVIIEMVDREDAPVVLIERRNEPRGWALPGGFVDVGETLEQAAVREAREETDLQVELQALLGGYSHPLRDPRGHTVSLVYVASARGRPRAKDDAKGLMLNDLSEPPSSLAFDHALILEDYLRFRQTGAAAPLRMVTRGR
jgi:8-oxo-dGTP diphosphatase